MTVLAWYFIYALIAWGTYCIIDYILTKFEIW